MGKRGRIDVRPSKAKPIAFLLALTLVCISESVLAEDEILDWNDPRCVRKRRSTGEDEEPHVSNIATNIQMSGGGVAFSLTVPLPDGPGSLK